MVSEHGSHCLEPPAPICEEHQIRRREVYYHRHHHGHRSLPLIPPQRHAAIMAKSNNAVATTTSDLDLMALPQEAHLLAWESHLHRHPRRGRINDYIIALPRSTRCTAAAMWKKEPPPGVLGREGEEPRHRHLRPDIFRW
jgi:hypothetical protein